MIDKTNFRIMLVLLAIVLVGTFVMVFFVERNIITKILFLLMATIDVILCINTYKTLKK